jgi:cytochrome c5
MTLRRITSAVLALAALVVMAACAASYDKRMQFLDEVTQEGVDYRAALLKQGTEVSEAACRTGWTLLQPDIPYDGDAGDVSKEWKAQVEEAYMKGCLTGKPRPRPEPSGVDAVTPVPHGSAPGESGAPSTSPTGSP